MSRVTRAAVYAAIVLIASLALAQNSVAANGPFVYVVTINGQFGAVDLSTGAFQQIGDPAPEPLVGLAWWNGSLLSITISGDLVRINPTTGAVTDIGPTGVGSDAFELAEVRGKLYLTDFQNDIYTVNPQTGTATLLRATGMPPDPAIPFSVNTDNTINLCDEVLYGVAGKLFATFDAFTLDPNTFAQVPDDCCGPALYEIDPNTGIATLIAPHTSLNLEAAVETNGKYYTFKWVITGLTEFGPQIKTQLLTLNLTTGATTQVVNAAGPIFVDAAAGGISGAAPAPASAGKSFSASSSVTKRGNR